MSDVQTHKNVSPRRHCSLLPYALFFCRLFLKRSFQAPNAGLKPIVGPHKSVLNNCHSYTCDSRAAWSSGNVRCFNRFRLDSSGVSSAVGHWHWKSKLVFLSLWTSSRNLGLKVVWFRVEIVVKCGCYYIKVKPRQKTFSHFSKI
mgnify:CR=1 FL=1